MESRPRTYHILLLPGDGIGPEVVHETTRVLDAVARTAGFRLDYGHGRVGGDAIDHAGEPLPDAVLSRCLEADAVLLGAVGGPAWDHLSGSRRPEAGLLKLRKGLGTFVNLRPARVPRSLVEASPLRDASVEGTDLLVVRELTGGIYFGEPRGRREEEGEEVAFNTMRYRASEVERVARIAFEQARRRRHLVTSVDKANVLEVSRLWRDVVSRVHREEFPDVELNHHYVDNAAMQLVLNPRQFDVILTGNLFGDILSDVAATLGGSLGLLPSASLGGPSGLFEPVHGSAPALAGKNMANPLGAILSGAMLLDELGEGRAAQAIRDGVTTALDDGLRTVDLWRTGYTRVSTRELGGAVAERAVGCYEKALAEAAASESALDHFLHTQPPGLGSG